MPAQVGEMWRRRRRKARLGVGQGPVGVGETPPVGQSARGNTRADRVRAWATSRASSRRNRSGSSARASDQQPHPALRQVPGGESLPGVIHVLKAQGHPHPAAAHRRRITGERLSARRWGSRNPAPGAPPGDAPAAMTAAAAGLDLGPSRARRRSSGTISSSPSQSTGTVSTGSATPPNAQPGWSHLTLSTRSDIIRAGGDAENPGCVTVTPPRRWDPRRGGVLGGKQVWPTACGPGRPSGVLAVLGRGGPTPRARRRGGGASSRGRAGSWGPPWSPSTGARSSRPSAQPAARRPADPWRLRHRDQYRCTRSRTTAPEHVDGARVREPSEATAHRSSPASPLADWRPEPGALVGGRRYGIRVRCGPGCAQRCSNLACDTAHASLTGATSSSVGSWCRGRLLAMQPRRPSTSLVAPDSARPA